MIQRLRFRREGRSPILLEAHDRPVTLQDLPLASVPLKLDCVPLEKHRRVEDDTPP
jgi:hypothetical protein